MWSDVYINVCGSSDTGPIASQFAKWGPARMNAVETYSIKICSNNVILDKHISKYYSVLIIKLISIFTVKKLPNFLIFQKNSLVPVFQR